MNMTQEQKQEWARMQIRCILDRIAIAEDRSVGTTWTNRAEIEDALYDLAASQLGGYSREQVRSGMMWAITKMEDAYGITTSIKGREKVIADYLASLPVAPQPSAFEVDFGGNVLARIEANGPIKVTAAMDGYGTAISLERITVKGEESAAPQPEDEPVEQSGRELAEAYADKHEEKGTREWAIAADGYQDGFKAAAPQQEVVEALEAEAKNLNYHGISDFDRGVRKGIYSALDKLAAFSAPKPKANSR